MNASDVRAAGRGVDSRGRALAHWCPANRPEAAMSRLTITLSEARYRALKEAAAQRSKTVGQLIDESLEFYGIKSRDDARELVRRARARSGLSADAAMQIALDEVQAERSGR